MARYRIKLKSREVIEREIPRTKQGWWADVCPGGTLKVRDATASDLQRCYHAADSTAADYFCEDIERGSLIPRYAAETVEVRR